MCTIFNPSPSLRVIKKYCLLDEPSIYQSGTELPISVTDEEYYDDDYDFWADEYSDITPIVYKPKDRINFKKYGKKSKDYSEEEPSDLPKKVYCDLVTTLNSKCVMRNLLEMWRYNEARS